MAGELEASFLPMFHEMPGCTIIETCRIAQFADAGKMIALDNVALRKW